MDDSFRVEYEVVIIKIFLRGNLEIVFYRFLY